MDGLNLICFDLPIFMKFAIWVISNLCRIKILFYSVINFA